MDLNSHSRLIVRQAHELGEWLGFETRNKYQITTEQGQPIGFAAEQQKGLLGFLFRQMLGHWRKFDLSIFDASRQLVFRAHHPFRFLFQRMELSSADGQPLGALQQRFAVFSKRFDLEDTNGSVLMEVRSPVWKLWTFPILRQGVEVAVIRKKWSGVLLEAFTDKDTFLIEFGGPVETGGMLSEPERALILAAALFIDLQYFERKAGNH